MAAGLFWQLQRFSVAYTSLDGIESQARSAVDRLLAGQAALAEGSFEDSNQAFRDAGQLIGLAKQDLHSALASSQKIAEWVDVTGTVKTGTHLLEGVEELARAGQRVSQGLEALSSDASLTESIEKAASQFGMAASHLEQVENNLDDVRVNAVPEELRGELALLQEAVPRARTLLQQFNDQADALLYILGVNRDRQYLVLLANNHELRPVGGFIGTVALVDIDRGNVETVDVSSVYDGDGQLRDFIAPPEQLRPITDRWYLRDSNWFVDYEVSAKKAAEFFEKEGGPTVDGVILMTPDVIQRLLEVTGPIAVPGYDEVVTPDNFITTTQEQVTYSYDRELNRPKQFLSDLTPLLLDKLFTEQGSKLATVSALTQSLARKEMLLYVRSDEVQENLRAVGWAGTIPKDVPGFLYVNNANIGGHKTDQFVEQEIDYRLQLLEDGDAEAIVTIRRTHTGPFTDSHFEYPVGEDPTKKDNIVYQRVLVPRGSELIEAKGFTPTPGDSAWGFAPPEPPEGAVLEADPDTAAWQSTQQVAADGTTIGLEANYTFFGNWLITEPGQTTVALYRYKIPQVAVMPSFFHRAQSFSATVMKQPGAGHTTIRTELVLPSGFQNVYTVPKDGITQENAQTTVYRGNLAMDKVIGSVFERMK